MVLYILSIPTLFVSFNKSAKWLMFMKSLRCALYDMQISYSRNGDMLVHLQRDRVACEHFERLFFFVLT